MTRLWSSPWSSSRGRQVMQPGILTRISQVIASSVSLPVGSDPFFVSPILLLLGLATHNELSCLGLVGPVPFAESVNIQAPDGASVYCRARTHQNDRAMQRDVCSGPNRKPSCCGNTSLHLAQAPLLAHFVTHCKGLTRNVQAQYGCQVDSSHILDTPPS